MVMAATFALGVVPQIVNSITRRKLEPCRVHDMLPKAQGAWQSTAIPMADGPSVEERVIAALRCDAAEMRSYRADGHEFSVLALHWCTGKISHRLVAVHTPDTCWTNSGWRFEEHSFAWPDATKFSLATPIQYRKFKQGAHSVHVAFWHLSDGKVVFYHTLGLPPPSAVLQDLLGFRFNQQGEQYFVRITSAEPLEQLQQVRGFEDILRAVGQLGRERVKVLPAN